MRSPLTLNGHVPKNLLESTTYKACIDGYVVALKVGKTRFTCDVSRAGYSSPLESLLRTRMLRDKARTEFAVDLGTLRAIREWVQSKTPVKVQVSARKRGSPKPGGLPRRRGRPVMARVRPRAPVPVEGR